MKDHHFKELFRKGVASGGKGNYKEAIHLFSSIVSQTDIFPQALLYLGRSYHALGEYEKAVTILKHFINRRPDSSAGYFFLGRSYCALEQYNRAVYCLKRARLRDGNNPHIESFIGLSYLKMRKPEKALIFLERAVQLDPDNTSIYTGYLNALAVQGVRLFHLGDMDLAGQIFRFIEKADKDSILTHIYLGIIERELGNIDQAIEHTDKAIALSDDPLLKLRRSSLLYQSGRHKEAADALDSLKQHYPEFQNSLPKQEELNKFQAISLFRENKYVKAIFHARNTLKEDPNDIDMHLLIGESYRNLGEFEKATNHFQQASLKQPNSLESHLGAAMVFWQMERYQEVLKELKRIESMDGDNDIVEYYRALCMSRLEYPGEESLPAVQSALKRYGPDLFLLNTLGNEYVRSGFSDLAEKWFKKAIQLAGNNRDSQLGLIRVYRESGKTKQEIHAHKDYLKEEPGDTEIRKQLIHLFISAKRYKEAVKEILKHDAYGRKEKSFQGLLALCYMKTDRFIDAAVIYRQLLRKNPENTEFLRGLIYCYARSGNSKNAVFFLEKALSHIKPTLSLSLILGVLKYKDGDTEGALEWFRKALSTSKKDWRAYQNIGIIYKRKGIVDFAEMFLSRARELKARETV